MKRNNRHILAGCMAALMLLLLTACGGAAKNDSSVMVEAPMASAPASGKADYLEMGIAQDSAAQITTTPSKESSVYQNAQAKLIRRAYITIQTTEFDETVAALDELVLKYDGYYENASVYGGSYRNAYANRNGEYVIRIPSKDYNAFLTSTGDLGYVVRSEKSSEDVGERYYDTEARLKTQRTKQDRLLALLEKAETMEDIISLENALSDVEYQIEQLSSTLNRYDALIDYSTFTISLNEVAEVNEVVGETASLWERMCAGFVSSAKGLVNGAEDLIVWFSYNVFGLVIAAVVVVFAAVTGSRWTKKRIASRRKNKEDQT